MRDIGIYHGSVLVVDKAAEAKINDIVVAVVGAEFVIKRLAKDERGIFLKAENRAYPPIRLDEDESLEIWGVVRWSLRDMAGA